MTDERKEGQRKHELEHSESYECKNCGLGTGYWPSNPVCNPAQPEPRGSEALAWQIANNLMDQNMLDVTCEQAAKVIEKTLAAATAERTPSPPSDFEYRLYGADVDKIIPPRQPASPKEPK